MCVIFKGNVLSFGRLNNLANRMFLSANFAMQTLLYMFRRQYFECLVSLFFYFLLDQIKHIVLLKLTL